MLINFWNLSKLSPRNFYPERKTDHKRESYLPKSKLLIEKNPRSKVTLLINFRNLFKVFRSKSCGDKKSKHEQKHHTMMRTHTYIYIYTINHQEKDQTYRNKVVFTSAHDRTFSCREISPRRVVLNIQVFRYIMLIRNETVRDP